MAYGPIVKDGWGKLIKDQFNDLLGECFVSYGCCYNPREANINIAISSFTCSSETSARAFGERLQKALKHMARIMCTDKGEQERKCAPSKKELQQKAQKWEDIGENIIFIYCNIYYVLLDNNKVIVFILWKYNGGFFIS